MTSKYNLKITEDWLPNFSCKLWQYLQRWSLCVLINKMIPEQILFKQSISCTQSGNTSCVQSVKFKLWWNHLRCHFCVCRCAGTATTGKKCNLCNYKTREMRITVRLKCTQYSFHLPFSSRSRVHFIWMTCLNYKWNVAPTGVYCEPNPWTFFSIVSIADLILNLLYVGCNVVNLGTIFVSHYSVLGCSCISSQNDAILNNIWFLIIYNNNKINFCSVVRSGTKIEWQK